MAKNTTNDTRRKPKRKAVIDPVAIYERFNACARKPVKPADDNDSDDRE